MLIVSLRFVDFFLFNQLKEVKDLFLKIPLTVQKHQKYFTTKNNYKTLFYPTHREQITHDLIFLFKRVYSFNFLGYKLL